MKIFYFTRKSFSPLAVLFTFSIFSGLAYGQTVTNPATGYLIPAGIGGILVQVWGGGGGGGGAKACYGTAGGGGGGAFSQNWFAVTPGNAVTITSSTGTWATTGGAGTAGPSGNNSGGGGGNITVNVNGNTLVANGGTGGGGAGLCGTGGKGNGGTASTGSGAYFISNAGGNGAAGGSNSGGGGGGAGCGGVGGAPIGNAGGLAGSGTGCFLTAAGGVGANAQTSSGNNGIAATAIGGGGSGGYGSSGSTKAGGAGYKGQVILTEYPLPTISSFTSSACIGSQITINGSNFTGASGTSPFIVSVGGTGCTGVIVVSSSQITANIGSGTSTGTVSVTSLGGTVTSAGSLTIVVAPGLSSQSTTTCSAVAFSYTPTSSDNLSGVTYAWASPGGSGFTGGASGAPGATAVTGTLTNTTSGTVTATYSVTPTSATCGAFASFTVSVVVNPAPSLSSQATSVCGGLVFSYTPTGTVPSGTSYAWAAPTLGTGLTGGASGSGSYLTDVLSNTTSANVTATYAVTATSACGSSSFTVTVSVDQPVGGTIVTTSTSSGTFPVTATGTSTYPTSGNGTITAYIWGGGGGGGGDYGGVPSNYGMGGGGGGGACGVVTFSVSFGQTYSITVAAGGTAGSSTAAGTGGTGGTSAISGTAGTWTAAGGNGGTNSSASNINQAGGAGGSTLTGTGITGNGGGGGTYGNNANGYPGCGGGGGGPSAAGTGSTATNACVATQTGGGGTYTGGTGQSNSVGCGAGGNGHAGTVGSQPGGGGGGAESYYAGGYAGGAGGAGEVILAYSYLIPTTTAYTGTSVCSGFAPAAMGVSAIGGTGSGYSYQWDSLDVTGLIWVPLSGATNSTYVPYILNNPGTYEYQCSVTNSCGSGVTAPVTFTVVPAPVLSTQGTTICSTVTFSYTPTGTNLTGVSYSWAAPTGTGFTGGASGATGATAVTGTLTNTTSGTVTATYSVTPTSSSCSNAFTAFTVTVAVNPAPSLSSQATSVCGGVAFSYAPTGTVPSGTSYAWAAPTLGTGLTGGASGSGSYLTDVLSNTTSANVTATYAVTATSACGSSSFTVTVSVDPAVGGTIVTATTATSAPVSFTTAGTSNWTVPGNALTATAQCWGAGGGGGTPNGAINEADGGGGGGAFTQGTAAAVTPGALIPIVVGAGGGPGVNGGFSSFNGGTAANGGQHSATCSPACNSNGGAGGTAGTYAGAIGANGNRCTAGGNGGNGSGPGGVGTGGAGGTGSGGGNAGNGTAPGGGGGGSENCIFSGIGAGNGGTGAAGQVLVTYTYYGPSATPYSNTTICSGSTPAVMAVNPSGGTGSGYTYQWYSYVTSAGAGSATAIGGATNSVYTPGVLTATTSYYCVITNTNCGTSAASNTITITVNSAPVSASISDVLDPCNGGHTAYVTINGGASPYSFFLSCTNQTYTNQAVPVGFDAQGASSCTISNVIDANGCPPISTTPSSVVYSPLRTLTAGNTQSCTVLSNSTQIFFDASANLMLSLTTGTIGLGSTTVEADVDGSVQQTPTAPDPPFYPDYSIHAQSYLQRHFTITPSTQASATVCLYISDAEVSNLNLTSQTDDHLAPAFYTTFNLSPSSAGNNVGINSATEDIEITQYEPGTGTGIQETPGNHGATIVHTYTSITATHNPTVDGFTYTNVWGLCFNVNNFSGLYIHAKNVNNNPLPVTLLIFTAIAIDNKYIRTDWSTASETNNAGFEVERSIDGVNFADMGWVVGHGNSTMTNTYEYNDLTTLPGIVYYYRLRQVDIDGNATYSNIASAMLTAETGFTLENIYPNPANSEMTVGVISNVNASTIMTMTDILGRVVMTEEWPMSIGYNVNQFDISKFADGAYTVMISSGNIITFRKLIITR